MQLPTVRALADEITKIAQEGSGIGQLVFPERDKIPSVDANGGAEKRQNRNYATVTSTNTSPDPEPRVPTEDPVGE